VNSESIGRARIVDMAGHHSCRLLKCLQQLMLGGVHTDDEPSKRLKKL